MLFWIGHGFLYYLVAVFLSVVTVSDKKPHAQKHCWIYCCTQIFADSLRNLQNSIVFINPSLSSNPTSFLFKKYTTFLRLGKAQGFSLKGVVMLLFRCFRQFRAIYHPSLQLFHNGCLQLRINKCQKFKIKIRPKGGRRTDSKCADTSLVV